MLIGQFKFQARQPYARQFGVLYPGFLRVFKEKGRVTTAIMLYKDDTLHEEDVLMTFHESEVQNSAL